MCETLSHMETQEVQLWPVIPAFGRLKQVDEEFEVNYIVRPFLQSQQYHSVARVQSLPS